MIDSFNDKPWKLFPGWMNSTDSSYWMSKLVNQLSWNSPAIRLYGKTHVVPRLTCFLAENSIRYRYSGIVHCGEGWPDWFIPILNLVKTEANVNFNGCLLNLYRNGNDRMGWHSDDEIELDSSQSIASLSLGACRDFFFKHKLLQKKEVVSLSDGDLLLMFPTCQKEWLHSLPNRKRISNMRINLTFRRYL